MPSPAKDPRPPTTLAGRALIGWIKPNLRAGLQQAVLEIESEAGRAALVSLRDQVAALDPPPAEALRLIDEALERGERR